MFGHPASFFPEKVNPMKLSTIAVNPTAVEDGEWVKDLPEMGDLELKVRGQNSASWRTLQRKLVTSLPRNLRNRADGLPMKTQDDMINKCLVGAALLDWKNLELDTGPVPYSRDLAEKLISDPAFQVFRDAVLAATVRVGTADAGLDEDLAKN